MGQFSVEKPVAPGSVLSGNQQQMLGAARSSAAEGDIAVTERRYREAADLFGAIDSDKIEEERKFDGVFVLRTNIDLNPLEALLCYKRLWMVAE
jgi:hypothetical protein